MIHALVLLSVANTGSCPFLSLILTFTQICCMVCSLFWWVLNTVARLLTTKGKMLSSNFSKILNSYSHRLSIEVSIDNKN